MTLANSAGSAERQNVYNGDGRRVQTTEPNGTVTNYVYDGHSIIEDVRTGTSSQSAVKVKGVAVSATVQGTTTQVFHLPGICTIGPTSTSLTVYDHANMLGSTIRTDGADASTPLSRTEYDAYGQPIVELAGDHSRYPFGGRHGYQTDDSGLVLCGARYYLPTLGRFLTQDPSGQSAGLNQYEYCGDNPQSKVDPSGLSPDGPSFESRFASYMGAPIFNPFAQERAAISKWWDGIVNYVSGYDFKDANHNPVRVGGWVNMVKLNPTENGMTFNGTVHLADLETWNNYSVMQHWMDHEEGHIVQGKDMSATNFLLQYGMYAMGSAYLEYAAKLPPSRGGLGHDYNPIEIWAENYAWGKEGRPMVGFTHK